MRDLVYWGEDCEYFLRLERGGHLRCTAGGHVRRTRSRSTATRPAWHYYYLARNSVWGRIWLLRLMPEERGLLSRRLGVRLYRSTRLVARLCARIVLRDRERRLAKLAIVARGVLDGLIRRLGPRIALGDGELPSIGAADSLGGDRVPRVLLVIDRVHDLGGAEGSTALVLKGLHDQGIAFGAVGLYGIDFARREELEALGARFYVPEGTDLRSQFACVQRAIREVRPDLVHTTLARADLVGRVAARTAATPVVTSIVNTPYSESALAFARSRWRLKGYQALDRLLAHHATFRFHSISDAAATEAVRALGVPRDRITVVTRGRDNAELGRATRERRRQARALLGLDDATPVVLNVARQDRQKGHPHLVEAIGNLGDRFPDLVLVIAGRPGNATDELRELITRHGLDSRVRLLGMRDDVPELLCCADVFAFPSLYEGLGGALLEALALEVPIVAFDAPAVAEAVGDAAVLAPVGDTAAFTAALEGLLCDAARRSDLAARGRARFEALYTDDVYLDAMHQLYREIIDDAQASGIGVRAR